jgi:multidrug efflux system membrane fusion protein
VKLRAVFDNPTGALFPNQFVNARLRVDTLQNAILIPTVAIQYNGQQAFVYRIRDNNIASIQNITLVNSEQSQSAVQGLQAGDQIITSNFDRVEDGAQVTIAGAGVGSRAASAAAAPAGGQAAGSGSAQAAKPANQSGSGPAQGPGSR